MCILYNIIYIYIHIELYYSYTYGGTFFGFPNPHFRDEYWFPHFRISPAGGATSLKEELVERVPVLRDAGSFREARRIFREVRSLGGFGTVEILLRSDVD